MARVMISRSNSRGGRNVRSVFRGHSGGVKLHITGKKFRSQITVSSIHIRCMKGIPSRDVFIDVKHGSKGYHMDIVMHEILSPPYIRLDDKRVVIKLPENNTGYDALLIEKLENGKYRVKLTTLKEILGDPREFWRLHDENAWVCGIYGGLSFH